MFRVANIAGVPNVVRVVRRAKNLVFSLIYALTKPSSTSQGEMLKYFGTWDDDDVKTMDEIIEERANFSHNRE